MLLKKIVNRLQGEVRIRVVSGFPERVLNLCGARKLTFWDVCWVSPTEFVCSMSRQDYRSLRQAAKNLDCTLTAERKAGAPYFLRRFRRRYVLVYGLILCVIALIFGSFFIWNFQIEGNESVTDEEILRCLATHGVKLGTFGFGIDSEDLRNHVLLEMPELVWITVNVSGCQAQVQVRERLPTQERVDKRAPQNVVARRDGLVLKITALGGEKRVLAGTTVEQGQLLISGVEDTGTFGARLKAGMGSVTARTWYTLRTKIPLTEQKKTYTGEEKTRWSLIFGTHRIKLYGSGSYSLAECDKISTRKQLYLFGIALPITVERETRRYFTLETVSILPETVREQGETLLTEYLHTLVDPYGAISSALCTVKQDGDTVAVTLTAECVEQIGETVPIYTETPEE